MAIIFCSLIFVSCGITLKNTRWYGDAGDLGANWFTTLSNESGWVGPNEWAKERVGMICTDSANFIEWKKDIEQLCTQCNCCTKEQVSKVSELEKKALDAVAPAK